MNTHKKATVYQKILSIVLCLLMICSITAVTGTTANAASTVKVKIASVTRLYSDAKSFLTMINNYRAANSKSALVMDKTYLDNAMLRAAELSIYASSISPNGQNGTQYISGATSGGQLIGYDVRSMQALLNDYQQDSASDSILLNSNYKSIGVGVVNINGYKYVCLLLSTKNATPVADSVLSQYGVTLDQEVESLPIYISEMSLDYLNNSSVTCGGSMQTYVKVINATYPTASVYLTAYGASVSISDTSIFKYGNDDRVYALKPGTATMRITYGGNSSLSVSCKIKAIGKSLSSCTASTIPDQIYTGNELRPQPTITDSSGNKLVLGTDYTLTYSNNINVGTATVKVVGMNYYEGDTKELHFNIVSGGGGTSNYFKVTIITSLSTMSLGQSVKITAIPTGGTTPIKYTYSYALSGSSTWTNISSNTTSTSCTFKPTAAGTYNVRVTGTDNSGLTSSQTSTVKVTSAFSVSATITPSSPTVGGTINLTAKASGASGTIQYGFYVLLPSTTSWKTIQNYSTTSTASYHPTNQGSYQFCVKAKNSSGTVVKEYYTVKVTASTLANKSSVSKTTLDLGETIALYGSASGGSTPYTYAYFYKKSTEKVWHTIKNYSVSTKVTLKPQAAKKYNICIKVKDTNGNIEKKYIDITVNPKLANASTVNTTSIAAGKSVTITCKASGGTAPYQYAVYYMKPNATTYLKSSDYGTTTSRSVKLSAKGKNVIRVKVKDAQGIVVNKDFTITVT